MTAFLSRRLFVAALAILLAITTFDAREAAADPQSEIRAVIEAQLDAFQRDAGPEAFSYASPDIRRKFQTPTLFMHMVKHAYPAVYRPQAVEFREFGELRGQPAQMVYFIGPDGRAALARYIMERQEDGRWLIDGVLIEDLPEQIT